MLSQLQCALLPAVLALVVGDYHADHSGQSAAYNTYPTHYSDYSYAYNNSVTEKRRVFTDDYTLSKIHLLTFMYFTIYYTYYRHGIDT